MRTTIIAVGNGGYNLATDIIKTNTFPDSKFIVCDTNSKDLEQNKTNADKSFLLEKFRGHVKASLSGLVDDVVDASTDTIILCATFGGMTGSKFAPLIALNAILKSKFICSLITLSFIFEGDNHNKLASNARMQTIAASNLVIQQNNDRLKEIGSLGLGDMNKPIVDTTASVLRNNTLKELSLWVGPDSIHNLIPKEYQIADMPLLWLRSDSYRGISQEERMNVFNLYA